MNAHANPAAFLDTLKRPEAGATPVTVAFGDGIGPEIMQACLKILVAAGARLAFEPIDIGERVYLSGNTAGIAPEAWDSLRRTKVFYKAPITTPQGADSRASTSPSARRSASTPMSGRARPMPRSSPRSTRTWTW